MIEDIKEPEKRRLGTNSRAEMIAIRGKPSTMNPAPPGPVGGHYKPLNDTRVTRIYDTTLQMLAEPGKGDAPEKLTEEAKGCDYYYSKLTDRLEPITWTEAGAKDM